MNKLNDDDDAAQEIARARAYSLSAMLSSNSVFGGNDDQACNDKNINNNA